MASNGEIVNTAIGAAILFSCHPYIGTHYRSSLHVTFTFITVSRVPAGSVYKMAHGLGQGLDIEVLLTMNHLVCQRNSNYGTATGVQHASTWTMPLQHLPSISLTLVTVASAPAHNSIIWGESILYGAVYVPLEYNDWGLSFHSGSHSHLWPVTIQCKTPLKSTSSAVNSQPSKSRESESTADLSTHENQFHWAMITDNFEVPNSQ